MTLTSENAIMFANKYLKSTSKLISSNKIIGNGLCLSDAVQYAYYASTPIIGDITDNYKAAVNGTTYDYDVIYNEPPYIGFTNNREQRIAAALNTRTQTADIVIKLNGKIDGYVENIENGKKVRRTIKYNKDTFIKPYSGRFIWSEDDILCASSILLNKLIFVINITNNVNIQPYSMYGPTNMKWTSNNILFITNINNGHYETFYTNNPGNNRNYISANETFLKKLNDLKSNLIKSDVKFVDNKPHMDVYYFSKDDFPLDDSTPRKKSKSGARRRINFPPLNGISQPSRPFVINKRTRIIRFPELSGSNSNPYHFKKKSRRIQFPKIN